MEDKNVQNLTFLISKKLRPYIDINEKNTEIPKECKKIQQ